MSDSSKVDMATTIENGTHAMETKNASTSTSNQYIVDVKGEPDAEKIGIVAAAGIETKIENYQNIRTQRRHYSEEGADEMTDVTNGEHNGVDAEGAVEMDEEEIAEAEAAARVEREEIAEAEAAVQVEIADAKEAARVEKGIVEECEGVRTQRKHFPGSTTSHIFG